MEKNTSLVLLSDSGISINTPHFEKKDEVTPSEQTIKNILNFSKALKVEQCKDGEIFVEYTAN
jgi:hypothetical protein